jgi:hypothetical protein
MQPADLSPPASFSKKQSANQNQAGITSELRTVNPTPAIFGRRFPAHFQKIFLPR